jgi:hypoxanthine-DNA glycosylase
MEIHPIAPVWNENSRILLLGSFPSVRSRQEGFFYGHPQNRFWKVLAALWDMPVPQSIPEKTAFLLNHRIALWDVIASCEVEGSADSSLRAVVPNDIQPILRGASIQRIFTNGNAAFTLYRKHLAGTSDLPYAILPSTSPANAAWSLTRLCEAWRVIREETEGETS